VSSMIDFRPVFYAIGLMLCVMAGAMLIPALVDMYYESQDWKVFTTTSALCLFIGMGLFLTNRSKIEKLSVRQAFLVTAFSWISISVIGALPFWMSDLNISFVDALFESTSGITTTGSTVLTGLDTMAPGILMWRSMLQWLGGVGIIIMAVSVLPLLQVGGMQFFSMEFSFKTDKILPRAAQITLGIISVYGILTALCAFLYYFYGMPFFDAINHSMTTIATGGFSTKDASLGYFQEPEIVWTATAFMVLASLPFIQYVRMVSGNLWGLLQDPQVRMFLMIAFFACMIVAGVLVKDNYYAGDIHSAVRNGAFNTISIMTGTGYTSANYGLWGGFIATFLMILMFIGGCVGSTTCGIKVFRIQILSSTVTTQIRRLLQPHGVFVPTYGDNPLTEEVRLSVTSFFYIYIFMFALTALLLSLSGLDFVTAFSGAATAISNVGPGLGDIIGPAGNFSSLSDVVKVFLCVAMTMGRLEFFTILVLFSPDFWKD